MKSHQDRFERHSLKPTSKIIILRTLIAFAIAVIDTTWVIYMESFGLSDSSIGFINSFLVFITLISGLVITPILEKFHEKKIIFSSLFFMLFCYIGFMFSKSVFWFIFFAIIYSIFSFLRSIAFVILLKDNTKGNNFTKEYGLSSSFINLGWFLGPILGGYLLAVSGFKGIFLYSSGLILLVIFLFFRSPNIIEKKHSKKIHKNSFTNLKKFLKSKEVYLPTIMGSGIAFWWSFVFIYVPLYIIDSGIGVEYIGIFLGLTQLPLAIFEGYAGRKAQKNGFRILFILGYALLGIAAFSSFFINEIYAILVILIIASISMAFIETQPISYFFKEIKSSDEEIFYFS